MDVHKRVCQAAIVDESGEVLDEFRFKSSREGIEGFALRLKGFGDGVRVAVESTVNLWIPLYDHLEGKAFRWCSPPP